MAAIAAGLAAVPAFGQCTLNGNPDPGCTLTGPVTVNSYTGGLGTTTTATGTITGNSAAMQISGGFGNNTFLNISSDVTLNGSGTLTLNSGDNNGKVFVQQSGGSFTLANSSLTIDGYGIIGNGGLTLANQATVSADANGQTLNLNGSGGVTNTGFLQAAGGGTLQISSNVLNTGGTIQSLGATGGVNVSATIQNGTLAGSGLIQTNGSSVLNGVTISSGTTYTAGLGTTTGLVGSLSNSGNLQVNAGFGNNTVLNIQSDLTLSGGGTVTLNSGDNNGRVFVQQSGGSFTLTNADNTIQGYGTIGNGGLALANQASGLVTANVSGQTLTLNGSGGINNAGTLEAANGGTLQVSTNVTNTGAGGLVANNGSTVNVSSTINGGTLTTNGTGLMQTNASALLNGVTISSGSTYTGGLNTTTGLTGTLTNGGNLQLNAGFGNNTILNIDSNVTLSGGTVTLNSGDNNGSVYIQQSGGSFTLTNAAGSTIQGYGVIGNGGLTVVNQTNGTIDANVSGRTLALNGSGGVANQGLMQATGGGVLALVVSGTGVTNAGGTILAGTGSAVNVNTTITGGTLTTNGTGVMQTAGSATLDGVTISSGSTYTGGLNSTTNLLGTITNNGTLQLNAGSGNNTILNVANNVTLGGGGTVNLNSGDNNGNVYIQQSGGSFTLTNTDNTIQGYGHIGNGGLTVLNESQGIISANSTAGTLTLDGSGGVTNQGKLQATGGGTLQISTAVNNAGGTILANTGSTVNVSSTITGGTLTTNGTGVMQTNGSATLQNLTLSSGSTYAGGGSTTTAFLGTITNQGNFQFTGGNGVNTFLNISNNVSLDGGGTLTLNSRDNNGRAFIQQSGGSFTLTNTNNTIQGYGTIGNGGLTVVNGANGTLLANVSGQTLVVNGSGGLSNSGTMKATNGGTLQVTSPLSNFSGGALTGGTYAVNGTAGVSTLQLASLGNSGGEITVNAATITLDGKNANVNFVDNAGKNALSNLSNNQGNLNIEGGYTFNAPNSNFVNSGDVLVTEASTFQMQNGTQYIQSSGEIQVDGQLAATLVQINGGILAGGNGSTPGIVTGNVTNGGTVQAGDNLAVPVDPPGTLNILGDYHQLGGASLIEDIASASSDSLLNVSGNATLDSNSLLTVNLLNGFDPTTSESFLFMTYGGTLNADNFVLTNANVDPFGTFSVDYSTPHDVFLDFTPTGSPVPEPASFLPLAGLLAGLVRFGRARRNRREV